MGVRAAVGRIPAIDGVRGIAVLWVIAFHYAALGDASRDPWLTAVNALPGLLWWRFIEINGVRLRVRLH